MNTSTAIEWTDATWNPISGCDVHTAGCINCYAMRLAGTRLHQLAPYAGTTKRVNDNIVWNGMLTALPDDHRAWTDPVTWRGAKNPKLGAGKPSLIFAADMCDLFHRRRPVEIVDRVIAGLIHSRHIGQILTKRADGMATYIDGLLRTNRWLYLDHPLFKKPNFDFAVASVEQTLMPRLWLGTSAERPKELTARWRYLRTLAENGWQTFISMEPLLERMTFQALLALRTTGRKPWIIVGGESGPGARPMQPGWAREIRDACAEFGLPFFFKRWGAHQPNPAFFPRCDGRLLDGHLHSEFPAIS